MLESARADLERDKGGGDGRSDGYRRRNRFESRFDVGEIPIRSSRWYLEAGKAIVVLRCPALGVCFVDVQDSHLFAERVLTGTSYCLRCKRRIRSGSLIRVLH